MRLSALAAIVCLSGCQWVTSLHEFEVVKEVDGAVEMASDAGLDAAIDATPDGMLTCARPDGVQCDVVKQCGCESDEHCQLRGDEARASCVKPGSHEPWSACKTASECPHGQTCDRGSCRAYCASAADCPSGKCLPVSVEKLSVEYGVCWKECETSDDCASGTACRTATTPFGDRARFCVAPFDPCPTVEDGQCDEAKGTQTCAEGTDDKDCGCTAKLSDASCDPVAQCGCDLSSTCEVKPAGSVASDERPALTAQCKAAGSGRLHAPCDATSDCQPGLFCHDSLKMCAKYCSPNVGCDEGACEPLPNRDGVSLGVCLTPCDRETSKPCPKHAACAAFDRSLGGGKSILGNYCVVPLRKDCPHNDVCDEPKGTRQCAEGTDTADCCKPPSPAGECDPISQCGCETTAGTQCLHEVRKTNLTSCQPVGHQAPGTACNPTMPAQCPPGYFCHFEGLCRKYCQTNDDCSRAGDYCMPDFRREASEEQETGEKLEGVGGCMVGCDAANPTQCADGTICYRWNPTTTSCMLPYVTCLELTDNQVCDEPGGNGSGRCAKGTDSECR